MTGVTVKPTVTFVDTETDPFEGEELTSLRADVDSAINALDGNNACCVDDVFLVVINGVEAIGIFVDIVEVLDVFGIITEDDVSEQGVNGSAA